jgi:hypothetical protein
MWCCVAILIVIVVILIVVLWPGKGREGYSACNTCTQTALPAVITVNNPFVWPSSGTSCVPSLYVDPLNGDMNFSSQSVQDNRLPSP